MEFSTYVLKEMLQNGYDQETTSLLLDVLEIPEEFYESCQYAYRHYKKTQKIKATS